MKNNEISQEKQAKRKLWRGWRQDAVKALDGISETNVDSRFRAADPALLEWLKIELERREKARVIRDKILEAV